MQINTLKVKAKRKRKIIGRGGKTGTTSGRGMNGQKSRSGAKIDPLFEGGRSTLVDHMKKKRGFKSRSPKAIPVSLEKIENKFKDGDIVDCASLKKAGLVKSVGKKVRIKILGDGEIKKKVTVAKDIQVSASAKKALEKAGGKVEKDK